MASSAHAAVLTHAPDQSTEPQLGTDKGLTGTTFFEGLRAERPTVHLDLTADTETLAQPATDQTARNHTLTLVSPDARPATETQDEPALPAAAPRFRSWSGRYVREIVALDLVVGFLAVMVSRGLADLTPLRVVPPLEWLAVGALVWPAAVALVRGYERSRVGIGGDEMRALLRAALLIVSACAIPAGLFGWNRLLTAAVVTAPIAVLGSLAVRFATRKRLHAQQRRGLHVRKVAVVGSVAAAADLSRILEQDVNCGMQVAGVCVPGTEVAAARTLGLTVLGDLEQVPAAVREFGCDAVAVTSGDATRHNFLRELSWSLEGSEVELLVHPGLIEVAGPRMHIRPFVGLPLLYVEQPHFTGWRRLLKRATDILLAGVGVLVISPVLALIALAIKLQDGGPVIFRQTRIGVDGRAFTMLKFRSMVVDAEARKAALVVHNDGAG
ncbi:MAG: sugar transferase, partial [Propionibacteriaceae bacterium]